MDPSPGPDRRIPAERQGRLRVMGIQNAFMDRVKATSDAVQRLGASIDSKSIPALTLLRGPGYFDRQRLRDGRADGTIKHPHIPSRDEALLQIGGGDAPPNSQLQHVPKLTQADSIRGQNTPPMPSSHQTPTHIEPIAGQDPSPGPQSQPTSRPLNDETMGEPIPQSYRTPTHIEPITGQDPSLGPQSQPTSRSLNDETMGEPIPQSHRTPTHIEPIAGQDPSPGPQSQPASQPLNDETMDERVPSPIPQSHQTLTHIEPIAGQDLSLDPQSQPASQPLNDETMDERVPSPIPQSHQTLTHIEPHPPITGQDPPPDPQSQPTSRPLNDETVDEQVPPPIAQSHQIPNTGGLLLATGSTPTSPSTDSQSGPERINLFKLQSRSHQHPVAFRPPTFTTNPFSPQNNPDHQLNVSQQVLGRRHRDSSPQGRVPKRLRARNEEPEIPHNHSNEISAHIVLDMLEVRDREVREDFLNELRRILTDTIRAPNFTGQTAAAALTEDRILEIIRPLLPKTPSGK
jgi:hypothetical protein